MYLSSPSMLSKNYSFFQPTNIYGLEKKGGRGHDSKYAQIPIQKATIIEGIEAMISQDH